MMKRLLILLCGILVSCDSCPETKPMDTSCFETFSSTIKNNMIHELNFSEIIHCFEWDRLQIHASSNHLQYKCFRFHQIDEDGGVYLGKNLDGHMDFVDGDRHWYFIHFYKDEHLIPEILAVSENIVSFDNLTQHRTQQPSFQKGNTNFYVTKTIYGGLQGKEMLKQRQVIKLPSK